MLFSFIFSADTKIISLAPNLTEIVCYLSGESRLAGITNDCNYPKSVTKLPKVGKYTYPDIEKIIALQPAAVIVEDTADKRFLNKLKAQKIPYKTYHLVRLKDLIPAMNKISTDFGLPQRRAAVPAVPAKKNKGDILIIVWDKPLLGAGRETFLSDYYQNMGYHNILPGGYSKINPELLFKPKLKIVNVREDKYLRLGPRLLESYEKLSN